MHTEVTLPAQMMAVCMQNKFKSCFIFLLLVVFIMLAFVHLSNIYLKTFKDWISSDGQQFQYFYSLGKTIQNTENESLIKVLDQIYKQAEEQTSTTTHVALTVSNDQINQSTTSIPVTELYHEAYPRRYHFILNEPDICEKRKPFLVLMVPVAPQGLEARNAIRSTWGNESVVQGKNVTVLFMLGLRGFEEQAKQQEQLTLESQQYHDLIQSNFIDSYKNLTIKTMVIMDWLATHCRQAHYSMKIDSDMFLNLENLMSLLLDSNTPKENYMTGMVMWNRPVIRNPSSKWYVPKEVYPDNVYPTYLLGMGYVFSNDLSEKIVGASKDIKPFYIEDAYVGACLKKLGLSPSKPPDPSKFKAYFSGKFERREFARVITTILGSPHQLVTFWKDLKMTL